MKGFAAVAVLLCFGTIIFTSESKTTRRVSSTVAPSFCESQYSCLDCWTVRICAPTEDGEALEETSRFTCPTNYWCDPSSGTCTTVMPEECGTGPAIGNFTCMRNGYFPDLTHCGTYYHCVDDLPYVHYCLGDTPYYVPEHQSCMNDQYYYYCSNENTPCDGLTGVKVPIQQTNNMFYYCKKSKPMAVDRCIGAYQFNETSQNCEPACPHAGLFPSDEDCTKYYSCSPATTDPTDDSYTMTFNLTCPAGQGFLEEAYRCINSSFVPNCNVNSTGLFNK